MYPIGLYRFHLKSTSKAIGGVFSWNRVLWPGSFIIDYINLSFTQTKQQGHQGKTTQKRPPEKKQTHNISGGLAATAGPPKSARRWSTQPLSDRSELMVFRIIGFSFGFHVYLVRMKVSHPWIICRAYLQKSPWVRNNGNQTTLGNLKRKQSFASGPRINCSRLQDRQGISYRCSSSM